MRPGSFFLLFLLIVCSESANPPDPDQPSAIDQQVQLPVKFPYPVVTTTTPKTTKAPETDEFLGSQECLDKKLTRASCGLVFCPPWQRCIEGQCACKPPYLCPTEGVEPVCGLNHRNYISYCQAMAVSCRTKKPLMSHFGNECKVNIDKFQSSLDEATGLIKILLPNGSGGVDNLLVCQQRWDVAAANVACKEHKHQLGAASADTLDYNSLVANSDNKDLPSSCVSVRCQGYETSLAECEIYNKVNATDRKVAAATCYKEPPEECGFTCANDKCIYRNQTCDGVDDCGDRSDEMCCKKCRNGAFRCRTGVCLHKEAVGDKVIDCLDGADESRKHNTDFTGAGMATDAVNSTQNLPEYISRKNETRANRAHLEAMLFCGIPNRNITDDTETEERGRGNRRKRVVGGIPANPTQIQWQVALEENRRIDCGGAYIGGCWVLTAAHCVRQNPSAFKVKFSLWKKFRAQGTTDIVPVEDIRIHPNYVPSTYENDIALIKLEKLPYTEKCLEDNPAIRAVCVPWTTQLFQPNHTCSISGWGRTADGRSAQVLLWANVSLISGCESSYKDRIKPGMMCAGDLEGSVDSCQGDSGGPLVCEDELGVSYLWGIVSWGERCGQQGFPGVYTQVAHYFEWIRLHTGWPAVTKFNS
ncbi:complement factor I-like [Fundulus heteroclitus]|uniref:complement factor I-like n=1 Tax=Fundulus heteroclitus TaxID=8078 RepID=UPI00165AC62F|nr:complement factor I-like [Fundulus heteroclitus]